MESNTRTITFKDKLRIVPFGDSHYGNKACDKKKADACLEWILNKEDTYMIGMGDYVDCILRQDAKRFDEDCIDDKLINMAKLDSIVNQQRDILLDKFKPLAEKGKILFLLEGNHETAVKKHHSFDIVADVCKILKIPYGGYSSIFRLTAKKHNHSNNIIIYAHHGVGGGRKAGSSMNALEQAKQDYEADIYLMGHNHRKIGTRIPTLGITEKGVPRIIKKSHILARTGTFLKTSENGITTYSEKAGYSPTDIGVVKITVSFVGQYKDIDLHISE